MRFRVTHAQLVASNSAATLDARRQSTTSVTGDFERRRPVTATIGSSRFTLEGAGSGRCTARPSASIFVRGGLGWMREVDETGNVLARGRHHRQLRRRREILVATTSARQRHTRSACASKAAPRFIVPASRSIRQVDARRARLRRRSDHRLLIGRPMSLDSFKTRTTLTVGRDTVDYFSLPALETPGFASVDRLPFSLKILLENLLRREDDAFVHGRRHPGARRRGGPDAGEKEISFMPARVLLQDFTGVPCVVDLAAMRDGIVAARRRSRNASIRCSRSSSSSITRCRSITSARRRARAERASSSTTAIASATCSCAGARRRSATSASCRRRPASSTRSTSSTSRASSAATTTDGRALAYPDTVFGTDSHTTMVNGLGVVGWGVGGIEAEAAMLGQPSSMLIPPVVGYRLTGRLPRRRDGDRSRAHDHRGAAQEGRRRQVRRVLRSGPGAPDDRRSRHARQHVPGVRRDGRDLPDRRR